MRGDDKGLYLRLVWIMCFPARFAYFSAIGDVQMYGLSSQAVHSDCGCG